jgi:glucan 1,3-beta-glucosidase
MASWNGFLSVLDNNAQNGMFFNAPPFECLVLTEGSVVVDHHEYQVFTNELVALQPWQHRQLVCNNAPSYSSEADKWVVVGE